MQETYLSQYCKPVSKIKVHVVDTGWGVGRKQGAVRRDVDTEWIG